MDFANPSTRSTRNNTVPKISENPKKCTVCHGTNQITLLIRSSMAGLQPALSSVGSMSVGSRISG